MDEVFLNQIWRKCRGTSLPTKRSKTVKPKSFVECMPSIKGCHKNCQHLQVQASFGIIFHHLALEAVWYSWIVKRHAVCPRHSKAPPPASDQLLDCAGLPGTETLNTSHNLAPNSPLSLSSGGRRPSPAGFSPRTYHALGGDQLQIPRFHSRNKTLPLCRFGACRRRKCWWSLTCKLLNVHDYVSCKSPLLSCQQISSSSISKSSFRAFAWELARQSGIDWSEFLSSFVKRSRIPPQKSGTIEHSVWF